MFKLDPITSPLTKDPSIFSRPSALAQVSQSEEQTGRNVFSMKSLN